ncbi:MAG: LVIVD repeat-containing protein, partial [Roseiflexaceae bacterium]
DRAYIAGLSGLFIFDVSNPLSPHLLGSFDSVGHGGGNSYNLDVIDTLAYLADGGGGLQIIDVSNPTSPTLRGSLDLPIYSLAVQVSDGLAYIAGREGGLAIVDVTNPAAPFLNGSFDTSGSAYDIQVLKGLAYVSDYTGGLLILDMENPSAPIVRGSYITAGNTWKSWVQNNLAYVAARFNGFRIVDLSTPARPRILSSMNLPGEIANVAVVGEQAYLCDWENGKLFIVDVGDPANPVLLGTYATAQRATDVALVGTLAYISDGGGGLEIVDVSDPAHPTRRGVISTNSFARGLDVVGNLAYIASEFGGLQIIDVTDPTSPTLRGAFTIQGQVAESVHVVDNLAYVAYLAFSNNPFPGPSISGGGLQIIDVSDPVSPTLRGTFDTGTQADDVQVVDDRAYIAAGNQALMLDVSDPANPQLLDSYTIPGQAEGIYAADGRIYVTGYLAGLQILSSSPELLSRATTITASGGQAASVDDSVQLQFSAGAVQDPITVLYLSQLRTAAALDGAGVAVRRFIAEGRGRGGLAVAQTNQPPYTLSVDYTDAQLAQLGISEANLNLAYWADGAWVNALPCAGCAVDLDNNRVTALMTRFTQFALVGGSEPTSPLPPPTEPTPVPPAGPTVSPAGGQVASPDGTVRLDFPAGAVSGTVAVTYTSPIALVHPLSDDRAIVHSFRLEARAGDGQPVTRFAQPFTMVISYTDTQLAALGVSEVNLNLAYWDGTAWIDALPCAGCGVDTDHNRVTVVLDRFGEFVLVANREHRVFVPLISR